MTLMLAIGVGHAEGAPEAAVSPREESAAGAPPVRRTFRRTLGVLLIEGTRFRAWNHVRQIMIPQATPRTSDEQRHTELRQEATVTFVIVTWNSRQTICKCLASLRAAGQYQGPVIVVDNASTDGTPEVVATEHPQSRLIRNECNRGFAAAANQGIAAVETPFAILLNPDTFLAPGVVLELTARMSLLRDVGAATCSLRSPTGADHASHSVCYPGDRRAVVSRRATASPDIMDVAWFHGALMAVRMEAVRQVGPLDQDFFMYYEDADWCWRMRSRGWRVVVFRDLSATHLGGGSSIGVSEAQGAMRLFRSELLFHKKHYRSGQRLRLLAKRSSAAVFRLGVYSALCAVSNREKWWRKWVKYRAQVKVLVEQLRGQPRAE